jgi:hypothetical protein
VSLRCNDPRVAVTRLITGDDAPVLEELQQANREFLAPWSPERDPRQFAGDYRGPDEVMAYFRRRRDLADRSFVITPRGTLADTTRVVHLADGEAVLGGETRRWRTVGILEVVQQLISECWLVPFDQYTFDEIWAARS